MIFGSRQVSTLFGGIGRALSHRNFRRFWAADAISTVGRWMYRMAVGWLTWELTESTSWLGILAFADTFPMVVLSVFAGAIADRVGYVRVIRMCQITTTAIIALFAILTLADSISIELVLALAFLYGSLEALSIPARLSVVHFLVPRHDLSAGIALGSATFNGARFIGPAIAGVLIIWVDIGTVLAICAAAYLQFFVVLLLIPVDNTENDSRISLELLDDIVHSARYVIGHPGIRFLMLLLGATGLLIRPFMELLPGFSDQVFDSGPDGMAMMMSAVGLGAMMSGLWLAQRGETRGLTNLVTISLIISALALILFTISGHIFFAAAFLMVVGFAMLMGGIGSQTLIQNTVDSDMRARVMSLFVLISWGLPAFGALLMGYFAEFAGLQVTIGVGGVVAALLWLWARRAGLGLAKELERA